MKIKVAAIQPNSTGSKEQVVDRAANLIFSALSKGVDIACLPEHWLPGQNADLREVIGRLKSAVKDLDGLVIAGADFVKYEDKTTIESIVIGGDGRELGVQEKVHLFGLEKSMAKPGNSYRIFQFKGVKFGIAICHDLVYPEVVRIFALQGAEILFVPSRIKREGLDPWELYAKARALENRLPMVLPNTLATPKFPGCSLIVDLFVQEDIVYPRVVAKANEEESTIIAEIDTELIREQREQRLKARRPSTYSLLLSEYMSKAE
ncbi:MAG: carbon-nitrogen hydrolase family protein [Conexivisphaerales archaeon]